ncbi:MAG: endopeptidase La [Planctomycetaceae bacterium]|nr:endopeptidase La [Planctomycetaceae bacterium]
MSRKDLLRKQLRAIQVELGECDSEQADVDELQLQIEETELPEEVSKECRFELERLERLPLSAPDYQVIRSYLEFLTKLPWQKTTEDRMDLKHARKILDRDYFGLEDVKNRIIEHLAVMKLNPSAKAPVLCFVGPPGVGKSSLGRSIAEAIGREFVRESLEGLSDESELRGHRRTFVGAMPGRILQAIQRVGVRNPLVMLDEFDKLGRDFRGDPAAALIEMLDPAQNTQFRDNYLNLPFDLSKVFFIATANSFDTIPQRLLDRIEVLTVSGYSDDQKLQIARRYLLPKLIEQTGLKGEQLQIKDDALMDMIRCHTRESGVTGLDRVMGCVCRKVARRFAEGNSEVVSVDSVGLEGLLGRGRFSMGAARSDLVPGVAAGLAWTPAGGRIQYVEAVLLPDSHEFTLTGQLGDIMKESAQTAQSFVRSQWAELNLQKQAMECGVHVHVPAGAMPKDGPSAGVAMATALASLYSHQPVRDDTAMTGEITLSGLVLPVDGIKEKVLAAHRAGMKKVILPEGNRADLADLPRQVRGELEFVFAKHVEQVVTAAIPHLANYFTNL